MELTKELLDSVRDIEGFPLGDEEDIIKLSDPPHYTACPNPFIKDFIEKYGKKYDEETDDYEVEPFAADVSEGKNDPIYNAHSYHTKVPPKAIMRYILHYTKPGDIVFDGFCGTGMTGVAAAMCENPDPEFKFKVEMEFKKQGKKVEWGARRAILNDLSPAATFIAYNYNTPVDPEEFEKEAKRILEEVERECGWMYETIHVDEKGRPVLDVEGNPVKGRINYTVWSDVFICPNCSREIVFWDAAVDKEEGKVLEEFKCQSCGAFVKKANLERAKVTVYDKALKEYITQAKQVPVLINYSVNGKRYEKKPDEFDLNLIRKIEDADIPYWYPTERMMFVGEKWGDTWRAGYHFGITHVHHFYTKRNLWVLSALYEKSKNISKLIWCLNSIQNYVNKKQSYGGGGGGVSGTLYIPSLIEEKNVLDVFLRKVKKIINNSIFPNICLVTTQSSISLVNIPSESIDYIFTDPPFGDNLMYSELNFIWEAWLRVFTNNKTEAVINKTQRKGLYEYQELMEKCFKEMYRILKPGRWMTVEFHNSKNAVWNAIQEAILRAGFVIANVRVLDKKQGTFKQVTTTSAVKKDLVISAYKPKESFEKRFSLEAGTEQGVWDFVRQHLEMLPVVVVKDGKIEVVPERQKYLLYDAMIAFHIQRGLSIPMGAAEFYKGLEERFVERDGMYFLPNQVGKYDAKRMELELEEEQISLIIDEKSAIQWLRLELEKKPQTYQEIQPKFLQIKHELKHEKLPELMDILKENFLQDEEGRWYVPDPNKQSDIEKMRMKNLLKEFEGYLNTKGKLKVFRTEAVRAGFKDLWQKKDYKTIVKVAERLPETVLQEDTTLLMYYDNALSKLDE
ncbi:DNA methylase [Thermovorax subterraneus]|nr:DNA methylase [Thermovorax subterraneus]